MSRLNTPTTIDAAPTATHTSLKAVEKQLGRVPNMFRVVANSPACADWLPAIERSISTGRLGYSDS
nr:hypothetical protein GPGIFMOB_00106 [Acinetobacter gerneri]